jgi:hypothetical protein
MGEFQMTELYSTIRGRQVVHGGSWLHICGDSLGLTVVFKYSRETGNAGGIVAACFWGLLRDNGCVNKGHAAERLDNIAQVQDTEQISPPNPPEVKH